MQVGEGVLCQAGHPCLVTLSLCAHSPTCPTAAAAAAGMGQVYLPDLRGQYNVLRVVLDAVQTPGLAARKPALFEQCLELLYELAASPITGRWCGAACLLNDMPWADSDAVEALAGRCSHRRCAPPLRPFVPAGDATLGLLRSPPYAMLSSLLDSMACTPLPQGATGRASALHQRAWLLQLHALELHRAEAALGHHADSLQGLLTRLFAADVLAGGWAGRRGGRKPNFAAVVAFHAAFPIVRPHICTLEIAALSCRHGRGPGLQPHARSAAARHSRGAG